LPQTNIKNIWDILKIASFLNVPFSDVDVSEKKFNYIAVVLANLYIYTGFMTNHHKKFKRLMWQNGLLLLFLIITSVVAVLVAKIEINIWPKAAPVKQITVCPTTGNCAFKGGEGLQRALDVVAKSTDSYKITILDGIYSRPPALKPQTVRQIDHNICEYRNHTTSFILKNAKDVTVQGQSKAKTIILGNDVHGLTILDSKNITIDNLALVSNGGINDNGIGDGSINLQNSTGTLKNNIITANSQASNPRLLDDQRDQEGVHLYGSKTLFTIQDNLIIDNFHTGVMLEDGADAFIFGNLITKNGTAPLYSQLGHGVTSYDDVDERTICTTKNKPYFNPDHWLRAWNNIIVDNSGYGVYIRGRVKQFNYEGKDVGIGIAHNTLAKTKRGIVVGAGYGAKNNTFIDGGQIYIGTNLVVNNREYGIWIDPDRINSRGDARIFIYYNNASDNGSSPQNNYLIPSKYSFISQKDNLQSPPQVDQYYQLNDSSTLRGKGDHNTDISSYSIYRNTENLFELSLYRKVLGEDYATLKNQLKNAPKLDDPYH